MKLILEKSQRLDKENKPYDDFYLFYEYQGKEYKVRVKPVFYQDLKMFYALSSETAVPKK